MRDQLITGHKTLRGRLNADKDLQPILVSDFLQGSYRRYTAVRPKADKRSDVDIIIVTKLDESEFTPTKALALFEPFLNRHYNGKWRAQGRSFGIEMSYVELDVVPTSAPAEQEYGILKSDSVTSDENIVEAHDWRLHRSWLSPEHVCAQMRCSCSKKPQVNQSGRRSRSASRTVTLISGMTPILLSRFAGPATKTQNAMGTS
jgi:hypothetical protein